MAQHDPLFKSAVFVLLKDARGQYLLQKRQNTGYMDDRYDTSMSGHVEPGESIYDTAVRETFEEIGVHIEPDNLKLILVSQMAADDPYLNFVFLCEKWQGEPRVMEPEKCAKILWCDARSMPSEMTPTLALLRERRMSQTLEYEFVDAAYQNKLLRSSTIA